MRYEIQGNVTQLYDNKGKSFLIDTDQLERVLICNWYVDNNGYVRTASRKYNRMCLHKFILNTGNIVDHINRIKTDNRLCNLRECTVQENNRNRVYLHTKSNAQGVVKVKNKYRARITVNNKRLSLGYFDTLEDAKRAYEEKAKEIFKEYAPFGF